MVALGIEPETSGFVAGNSDHQRTEAVIACMKQVGNAWKISV
jgi:hypothetical protein